ncbi:MAG TPA: LytTR family transcriptional regulator DNA-binding domain-containing protein [Aliicoccus persicus]|uniref:LytTR family transcriptional regulator DNA-binding domain-containing protein n=1 Tax=Aliicoccus persicus TaxID=930138 RepID=A0A921B644_9STAP|nr:LytTR family transcriptional regulator DNA-binding domain-containing protein [Aliicoccus persicus]
MNIAVKDIIDKNSTEEIRFIVGEPISIQMPFELTEKITEQIDRSKISLLNGKFTGFDRLSILEHIKFYKQWNNTDIDATDLLKQFDLESYKDQRFVDLSDEFKQRLAMIHVLLSNQESVLAIDPFMNMTNANIRLFHKMMSDLNSSNRSIIVVVTKTEDAFLVSDTIYKLNNEGLNKIETEADDTDEPSIRKIKARAEDKTIFIDVDDIEFIESNDGKVFVNVGREKFALSDTLTTLEQQLLNQGFYRCHRSYIINLKKVAEIITWSKNSYSVVIDNLDQTKVPLSRNKFNEIQDLLMHY